MRQEGLGGKQGCVGVYGSCVPGTPSTASRLCGPEVWPWGGEGLGGKQGGVCVVGQASVPQTVCQPDLCPRGGCRSGWGRCYS